MSRRWSKQRFVVVKSSRYLWALTHRHIKHAYDFLILKVSQTRLDSSPQLWGLYVTRTLYQHRCVIFKNIFLKNICQFISMLSSVFYHEITAVHFLALYFYDFRFLIFFHYLSSCFFCWRIFSPNLIRIDKKGISTVVSKVLY